MTDQTQLEPLGLTTTAALAARLGHPAAKVRQALDELELVATAQMHGHQLWAVDLVPMLARAIEKSSN